jgi:2-dehydro-3-deoxyphosphogluconate aldolase/(4S)-4-hydroxy-2-oxoglutarate aldolase
VVTTTVNEFLTDLADRRLVAILRGRDPEATLRSILVLVEEGVDRLEVSLSGADALTTIRRARAEVGDRAQIGAGTVLTRDEAAAVHDAGATFVVTPALAAGTHESVRLGLPVLCGALTPTEVVAAVEAGATAVKLFPASWGGPGYLRALRDPLPQVPFVPVGGVAAANVGEYLDAGAIAVGVGSPLLGDAPHGGDLDALRQRARAFLDATRAPR